MQQPWMLFQAANPKNPHTLLDLHYFWNGTFAIVVLDGEGLSIEDRGWTGKNAEDLSDEEVGFLNNIAANKRKQVFTNPRTGRTYRVSARGYFPEVS